MTPEPDSTVQLAMSLGADALWADVAVEEESRSADATRGKTGSSEERSLLPIDQWRQTQPPQLAPALDVALQESQLYEIDGGIFRAKEEDGRWALHTWMGKAGYEVTRTGFEVGASGALHDRLYDVMEEEMLVLTPARFTVEGLQPVTPALEDSIMQESKHVTAFPGR